MATSNNVTSAIGQLSVQESVHLLLAPNAWTASYLNVEIARRLIDDNFPHVDVEVRSLGSEAETLQAFYSAPDLPAAALEIWPSAVADIYDFFVDDNKNNHDAPPPVVVNQHLPSSSSSSSSSSTSSSQPRAVDLLGELGVQGQIGWYVPDYVVKQYPEAVSWEFYRQDAAAQLFSTPETEPYGRFLSGDPGWPQFDAQIIKNLELPFQQVYAGNETALVAALEEAVSKHEPILMYWWSPTAVAAQYNLVKVALPEVTEECKFFMERSDGFYDCDYPVDYTFKIASASLRERAPDVHRFLQAFSMSNEDQLEMLPRIVFAKEPIESVAADWINRNQAKWITWVADAEDDGAWSSASSSPRLECVTFLLSTILVRVLSAVLTLPFEH